MKRKLFFTTVILTSLITLNGCMDQMNNYNESDYNSYCPTVQHDTDGKIKVMKTDQKDFYMTSDGNIYSQREIINLSNPTFVSNNINSIFNSITQSKPKSDPNTAKKIIILKYTYRNDSTKSYCAGIFADGYRDYIPNGTKYILNTSELNLNNKAIYNGKKGNTILKEENY